MKFTNRIVAACALALASLSLGSCASLGAFEEPPAPLAATVIDEGAMKLAFQSFDVFLDSVNALLDAGVIVPGSPTMLSLADRIDTAQAAMNAADDARRAANATGYAEAMSRAEAALREIRRLIKGSASS